jgi:hypothetical protein
MSGSRPDTINTGADLQAIIAAKISLREEIKTELRAEFNNLVENVRGISTARFESVQKALDDWREEVTRQANERADRNRQRFEAVEAGLSRVDSANKEVIETRLDAIDHARGLLARELDKREAAVDARIIDLRNVMDLADRAVDDRAQSANNAIEKQLASSIVSNTMLLSARYEATQIAVDRAVSVAGAAIDAVDKKSLMRSETCDHRSGATEDKLMSRMNSLKDLIDLGNEMGKEAIIKAENATEKRFEGLNELRGVMTDQAAAYLPRAESDAKFKGIIDKMDQISLGVSNNLLDMKGMVRREDLKPIMEDIGKLRDVASTSGGKNHVWGVVGGGALSVAAIIVALFAATRSPTDPIGGSQVSTNSGRISDVVAQMMVSNAAQDARMTALTNQINQLAASFAKTHQ